MGLGGEESGYRDNFIAPYGFEILDNRYRGPDLLSLEGNDDLSKIPFEAKAKCFW